MIFISTGFSKENPLITIKKLTSNGINNIELSGGKYENHVFTKIKKKFPKTKFLLHNYFPPAKKGFVLNLASNNDYIYQKTINFYLKSIKLCKKYKIKKYGIHAGFFNDFNVSELGKKVQLKSKISKNISFKRLKDGFKKLDEYSEQKVKLYLENNVLTAQNLKSFNNFNPFIFTSYNDYLELRKEFKFKPLLDIGHLKVSSKTLKLNFIQQFKKFRKETDYFHLSYNNSLSDENLGFEKDYNFQKILKNNLKSSDTITLEIYDDINVILNNTNLLKQMLLI